MSAAPLPPSGPIVGRVASVNAKGIRLDGYGEWFNVSKFGGPSDVVLPERGDMVAVVLDARGFIRSLTLVDSAAVEPTRISSTRSTSTATRDTTITRLAVLKAAAEYAASKPSSSSSDVLKIAACWERWVLRDDAPPSLDDDLTDDAF